MERLIHWIYRWRFVILLLFGVAASFFWMMEEIMSDDDGVWAIVRGVMSLLLFVFMSILTIAVSQET